MHDPNDEVPAAAPDAAPTPEPSPNPGSSPPPGPTAPPLSDAPPVSDAPTTAWQVPAPPATPGWRLPTGPVPVPGVADHVIAGVAARSIAWILDGILVGLIPAILSLTLIDWTALMDEIARSVQERRAGEPSTVALPMTPEVLLVTLNGVGISYLY